MDNSSSIVAICIVGIVVAMAVKIAAKQGKIAAKQGKINILKVRVLMCIYSTVWHGMASSNGATV